MYIRIVPGISHDVATGTKLAWEAGKAFGGFIADLSDLPAKYRTGSIQKFVPVIQPQVSAPVRN